MEDERQDIIGRTTPVRRFAFQAAIALGIFTSLVFIGIFWRTSTLLQGVAREQASSSIDLIVNAREWNAHYSGVWVAKDPGVESNPYLRMLGVEPDTSTVSGQKLTLRNPAVMTNEISHIAQQGQGIRFRLTSLKPVNPADTPDSWEREVLNRFETDQAQVSVIENGAAGHVLRMMRPLVVAEPCLECHAAQGYQVGDVRGAISVTLPLAATDRATLNAGLVLAVIFAVVVVVGGVVGYRLVARMATRIDDSERNLHTLATTDVLTGIANRRAVLQRLDEELARGARAGVAVGVIELDVDFFKHVNDAYGHAAGDEVLHEIASRIVGALREYDVAGRLGGEEFLVVAPDIDDEPLRDLAERLRDAVGARPVTYAEHEILVTVSAGATLVHEGCSAESALLRADSALYAAKDAGRNRVEFA